MHVEGRRIHGRRVALLLNLRTRMVQEPYYMDDLKPRCVFKVLMFLYIKML